MNMTEAELLEVIAKAARENFTSLDLSAQNIKTISSAIAAFNYSLLIKE